MIVETDEELVKKFLISNNTTYFNELILRYEELMLNSIYKRIGNYSDAQDIYSDLLVTLHNKLHQFQGHSKYKTWLFTIVSNLCSKHIKKKISKRDKHEIYKKKCLYDEECNIQETILGLFDYKSDFLAAIHKLDEHQQNLLELRFKYGYSLQEISKILNIGLSATKKRLYTTLEKTKEYYKEG